MQIHLFDCKSNRQLVRNLAWSKLGECMMVVSELRNTYWGADFTYKLFEAAETILKSLEDQSTSSRAGQGYSNQESTHANTECIPEATGAGEDNHRLRSDAFCLVSGADVYFDQTYIDPL